MTAPRATAKPLGAVLLESGAIDAPTLEAALEEQARHGGRLGEILLARGALDAEALHRALGEQAGLAPVDLDAVEIPAEVVARVDASTASLFRVVPVREQDGVLQVALADPLNVNLLADLAFLVGGEVAGLIASEEAMDRALAKHYGGAAPASIGAVIDEARRGAAGLDLEDREAMASAAPVVKLLNAVLLQAIREKASDVHLEPFEDSFHVRYRVDGALFEVEAPPATLAQALIARVKVMSNLDIAETRVPQDGRIELSLGGRPIDLRVATLPTVHGESCVMRVLDRSVVELDLGRLGLADDERARLEDLLCRPNGIVLVTGPTGSGKTTTLYSGLSLLNEVERKIITTEDPIEYDIDGIVQVQVNEEIEVTYARVLRTILRQDPDVLLVGEIRDRETARIAVEAALTGHLVLSTLHTNDAPSTITRMVDIGVEPFLLVATLQAVVAQRLVRTICPDCRVEVEPDDAAIAELELTPDEARGARLARGEGCERCNWSGHRGRRALFEIMVMSERLRELVLAGASTRELRDAAVDEGMRTLRAAGRREALAGRTTVAEVLRETRLEA